MQRALFFVIVSLIALPFLAGCSNSESPSIFYTAKSGTFGTSFNDSSVVIAVVEALKPSFERPAQLPDFPTETETAFESCVEKVPAVAADVDGDGIALTSLKTYTCKDKAVGSGNYSRTGTQRETDTDDTSASGGYLFEYDLSDSYARSRGTVTETLTSDRYLGFFSLQKLESTFSYSTNYRQTEQADGTADRAEAYSTLKITGSTCTHTLTPDDASSPLSAGTVNLSGFIGHKLTGNLLTTKDDDFVAEVTSEGLVYSSACSGFYQEGTAYIEDGAGTKLKFIFSCTTTIGPIPAT